MCLNMFKIKGLSDEKLLERFLPPSATIQLINAHSNIYNVIMNTTEPELLSIKSLGNYKIQRIHCLRELFLRLQDEQRKKIKSIHSPKDVADYLIDMQSLKQEQFRILMLTCKNGIIGEKTITQGTINASIISPREIFNAAVKSMAASIIIVHNHPSGDPAPSQEDMEVTRVIVQAGEILGIHVLDHVIIGKNKFYSFKEHDLLSAEDINSSIA